MIRYNKLTQIFAIITVFFTLACHKPKATAQKKVDLAQKPAWLRQKIAEIQKDQPANPPIKIYSYQYHDQTVYYITSRCCDIPSQVFNINGQQLCQPDGGINGQGDGKCADFFQTRTGEKLIWEDLRK